MLKVLLMSAVMGCAGVSAWAEPLLSPDVERAADALAEAMKAYERALERSGQDVPGAGFGGTFGDTLKDGEVRRHRLIDDPDALRDMARDIERAIEDTDLFEGLAEMAIALSKDVEVIETGDGMVLSIRGNDVASLERSRDDRLTLRAGGRRITVEVD